ncbi:MAG: phage Gp37/Gp68 family protein [Proteobacteria bacterium]|nr:phage Gp37/Gp68 family protein [Pseudomonadota bacterium]
MADRTPIEWADATWNPIIGCSRVSEGCRNCYAEVMAARFSKPGQWGEGLAQIVRKPDGSADHRWTGKVRFNERALDQPLRWRKPRRIFVCSTSDLFHEGVPDEWLDRVFAVMALAPWHTFMVLTKRPERAREYLNRRDERGRWPAMDYAALMAATGSWSTPALDLREGWPLPNVWLGTSIEDQATADARIPHLLATAAAVRFVSAEPLLGPVDLGGYLPDLDCGDGLDLVIVGGESGPGARPMHPDWPRALRDQCVAAGTAFFFKQWGEWAPAAGWYEDHQVSLPLRVWGPNGWTDDGRVDGEWLARAGKKAAGRLLDGKVWDQMPGGGDGLDR